MIFFGDGVGIGFLYDIQFVYCVDQYEQCGFGQVEIGYQCVGDMEFIVWCNEDICVLVVGCDLFWFGCQVFDCVQGCCFYGDYVVFFCFGLVDLCSCCF